MSSNVCFRKKYNPVVIIKNDYNKNRYNTRTSYGSNLIIRKIY